MLPFCVTNGTGQRIADLAAARQFQQQEPADALDGDRSATDNSSTFTDGDQGGAIDFVRLIAACAEFGPYCLIGGLAVNCYVEPEYAVDADLVVVSSSLPKLCVSSLQMMASRSRIILTP